jgi:hypothetical protein
MTRATRSSDLGNGVVARSDEVVNVLGTGKLVVDGGASFRIFNTYGVDIQDVGTSTVTGSCGRAPGLQRRACRYRR